MHTDVLTISATDPDPRVLAQAVAVLQRGGLVAFPTETVYGLGANALDADAVSGIYGAKGRPPTNPVIVHVADAASAAPLVRDWPAAAVALAQRFWPGPLTLVVRKSDIVPDIITAGGPTVAVRAPAHPVARRLLQAAQMPVAAPSANASTRLSPTRAEHVLRDLNGRIDLLLDAGPTPGGIESTVLDLTVRPPRLLRPGLITPPLLEPVIGPIDIQASAEAPGPLRSPGMQKRHYAPRAALELVDSSRDLVPRLTALTQTGQRIGVLAFGPKPLAWDAAVHYREMPDSAGPYAAGLYAALHELDDSGVDRIIVVLPPCTLDWLAVHDRLRRGAAE